jgi:succinate-semialdehyde dehydrogenase/glutarate-semialdehyde dehydrogenase
MKLTDATLFRQQCFIDGKWCDAENDFLIEVINPADGEVLGSVPRMGAPETRLAIEAANVAFKPWSALPAKQRSSKLRKWFELMLENQEDLAMLITLEQGKSLTEARGEIAYAASIARRVSGAPIRGTEPSTSPSAGLITSIRKSFSASHHLPSMKHCCLKRVASVNFIM